MDIKTWLSRQPHAATSVFHMGRYCGKWKASTHATGNPSFHIVLDGQCWLSLEQKDERKQLEAGDIVFFFSNRPFYLLSSATASIDELPQKTMVPISTAHSDDTALLCGFLHPTNYQSELLFALMPECLVIKRDTGSNQRLHKLFDLLKIECWQTETESSLAITRLTDILLIYVVEELLDEHRVDTNLLLASQSEKLSILIIAIINRPSEKWTIEEMADIMHMSRSTFIRKVRDICHYSPNELVIRLRINIAVNLLRRGYIVGDVSQMVGYDSITGFCSAFRKITGDTPTEFLRQSKVPLLQ